MVNTMPPTVQGTTDLETVKTHRSYNSTTWWIFRKKAHQMAENGFYTTRWQNNRRQVALSIHEIED